jgi:signal transduction histidine kinase
VEDPAAVDSALEARATPPAPTATTKRQPFPTLGVVLVGGIMALGIGRELLAPEHGHTRYVFTVVRASEVVLDVLFLLWLGRRVDASRLSPGRGAALIAAINAVVGVFFAFALRLVLRWLDVEDPRMTIHGALAEGVLASFYLYGLWTLGFRYPNVVRAAHARMLEAAHLREQAELVQLRAHLQPHFLRNTLNAVSALMSEDTREARRMLATLGDLLSDSFETARPRHTLDDEVGWLRRYAQILEARHHGTLVFTWDVEPRVRGTPVPTLLLQPLVENAALHGALCRDGDGHVTLSAHLGAGGRVAITVEDNGPGFDAREVRQGALGLHLVRRRLAIECPGSTFRIDSTPCGTRAVVELP